MEEGNRKIIIVDIYDDGWLKRNKNKQETRISFFISYLSEINPSTWVKNF